MTVSLRPSHVNKHVVSDDIVAGDNNRRKSKAATNAGAACMITEKCRPICKIYLNVSARYDVRSKTWSKTGLSER